MNKKVRDPAKSPERRRASTYEAFESKVVQLEKWAENGLPFEAAYPKDHAALRRWTGPEGTFDTWKDPTIDRVETGKYPDLARRFVAAVCLINDGPAKIHRDLSIAQAELEKLRSNIYALMMQNADLISRIDNLERQKRLWRSTVDKKG